MQVSFTTLSLLLLLLGATNASFTCQAPTSQCIRGSGSDTIKSFSPKDPESASTGACCAACLPVKGCVGSQLVSRSAGDSPSCWLMATQTYKNPTPGETCNSTLLGVPPPPQRFNRTTFSGVWLQHGDYTDPAMYNASFLVGTDLPINWADIEVSDGVFDFTLMDQQFAAAAAAGLYIETALSLGQGSGGTKDKEGVPAWIYNRKGGNASVAQVMVASSQGKGTLSFPYYLDPTYQFLFLRVVKAFVAHIAAYPLSIRSFVVASQAMFGSTGDDTPWHGTPVDPIYNISNDQWNNFTAYNLTTGFASTFCKLYKGFGLPLLWNPSAGCDQCINHMAISCPGSFFKSGMESHGIFINYEADDLESVHGPICKTEGMHCRGEDWPFETQGNWISAPIWHQYAHLMEMLHFSLDMPGLSEPSLSIPEWAWAYDLFNKYAGSTRPPYDKWVGGIVSLRDGLDCANTDRFPEATFGTASITNKARFEAITAAFANKGATLGDPAAAMCSAMCSRRAKAMNDVGWRVLEGNFGSGGITQVSPLTTSIGHWQVGSKSDAYGRYARGFERASGKTEMAFVLEPRMFGGLPNVTPLRVDVRVVYYDMFSGGFNVSYDAGAGGCQHVPVAVGASGGWKSLTIPMMASQGYFGRKCGRGGGADIALTSTSDADSIISSLEVYKV